MLTFILFRKRIVPENFLFYKTGFLYIFFGDFRIISLRFCIRKTENGGSHRFRRFGIISGKECCYQS